MRARWPLLLAIGCYSPDLERPDGGAGGVDAGPDGPPLVVFGEGPSADVSGVTDDIWIREDQQTASGGGHLRTRCSDPPDGADQNALLRFDVSALPSDARILSAVVEIEVLSENLRQSIALHGLLEAWSEDATWRDRIAGVAWSMPGAFPPSSEVSALASFVPTVGPQALSLPVPLVQAWVAEPATNLGILFRPTCQVGATGQATWYHSEEADVERARPRLVVTYELP